MNDQDLIAGAAVARPTVYRIQDAAGRGPWRPGFSHRWIDPDRDDSALPPWFQDRALLAQVNRYDLRPGTSLACGCRTPEQLRQWFSRAEYVRLVGFYAFRAVEIQVDAIVGTSDVQCIFASNRSLWIDAQPFTLYAHPPGVPVRFPRSHRELLPPTADDRVVDW